MRSIYEMHHPISRNLILIPDDNLEDNLIPIFFSISIRKWQIKLEWREKKNI